METDLARLLENRDGAITANPLLMTLHSAVLGQMLLFQRTGHKKSRCRENPEPKDVGESAKAVRLGDTQDPEATKKTRKKGKEIKAKEERGGKAEKSSSRCSQRSRGDCHNIQRI